MMSISTDVPGREFRRELNEALAALASNDATAVSGSSYPFALDSGGDTGLRIRRGTGDWVPIYTGPLDPLPYQINSVLVGFIRDTPIRTASRVMVTPALSPASVTVVYTGPANGATPLPDVPVVDQTLVFAASETSKAFTTPVAARGLGLWSIRVDGYQVMATNLDPAVPVNTDRGRHLVNRNGITRADSAARSIHVEIRRLSL